MKDVGALPELKKAAALKAAALVTSGQTVGLGTGSTAAFAIAELGRRKREEGLDIQVVATSYQSRHLARESGLQPLPVDAFSTLDLSIDGADEIDPELRLIKGGGAAHTAEKLVHAMSRRFIVVADHTKRVAQLGEKFAVPLEVLPPAVPFVTERLLKMGAAQVTARPAKSKDGPVITDFGNFCLDARFEIDDADALERALNCIPGVVENGIFAAPEVRPVLAFIADEGKVTEVQAG